MTTEWIELKTLQDVAKAQADGWEIEIDQGDGWERWAETIWSDDWEFRARPAQPKTKIVKSLCMRYRANGNLVWIDSSRPEAVDTDVWQRFPAGDIEGEVME